MTPFDTGYNAFMKAAGFTDDLHNARRSHRGEETDQQMVMSGLAAGTGLAFAPSYAENILGLARPPELAPENAGMLGKLKEFYTGTRVPGVEYADVMGNPDAAMRQHQVVVDHGPQVVVAEVLDPLDFVRAAPPVEEMHEGNSRFQRGGLGNQHEVVHFLYRRGTKQAEAGLPYCHDVTMVAEDAQCLAG